MICLWSNAVGDKPAICITNTRSISLVLTLDLGLCPQSCVITMISYSCLWYNYNLHTFHKSCALVLAYRNVEILLLCSSKVGAKIISGQGGIIHSYWPVDLCLPGSFSDPPIYWEITTQLVQLCNFYSIATT